MTAYYNEHDLKAAAWLRELIRCGHIAPGDVDERSIEDVTPNDLAGYTQCHFFAGIGVWSYALRRAGWPDNRPVWTGSCPCQPFSAAGKGGGFADERHLWPAWHWLLDQCRPDTIFGEQVASKDGLAWFDLVSSDLEGSGYTVGASDLCAAGVGAPHIRQRLFFVAYPDDTGPQGWPRVSERPDQRALGAGGLAGGLDNPASARHLGSFGGAKGTARDETRLRMSGAGRDLDRMEHASGDGRVEQGTEPSGRGAASRRAAFGLADAEHSFRGSQRVAGQDGRDGPDSGREEAHGLTGTRSEVCDRPGPTNGHWRDADWLHGRDGKWRPVEPGTFPLADGSPARVGRLRGYGNAIVAQVAQTFIESYLETRHETLDYPTETA